MEPAKDFDLGTIGIGNLRAEAVDDGMLLEEVIAGVETKGNQTGKQAVGNTRRDIRV